MKQEFDALKKAYADETADIFGSLVKTARQDISTSHSTGMVHDTFVMQCARAIETISGDKESFAKDMAERRHISIEQAREYHNALISGLREVNARDLRFAIPADVVASRVDPKSLSGQFIRAWLDTNNVDVIDLRCKQPPSPLVLRQSMGLPHPAK